MLVDTVEYIRDFVEQIDNHLNKLGENTNDIMLDLEIVMDLAIDIQKAARTELFEMMRDHIVESERKIESVENEVMSMGVDE